MENNHYGQQRSEHKGGKPASNGFFGKWAGYFVTRWRVTLLLLLGIIIAGGFSVINNQRQDFPTIPVNILIAQANYPGASSSDMEKQVAIPIETAIKGLDDVDSYSGNISSGFVNYIIEMEVFENDALEEKASELNNSISQQNLPAEVNFEVNTALASGPTMILSIVGEGQDLSALLDKANQIEGEILSSSNDIKEIQILPEDKFKIEIKLDEIKVATNGINYQELIQKIQEATTSLPAGNIEIAEGVQRSIQVETTASSIEDLENLEINGTKLSQFAEINRVADSQNQEQETYYAGYLDDNGEGAYQKAVYMILLKKDDGDSINISNAVNDKIEDLEDNGVLTTEIGLEVIFDSSPDVERQISQLISNGAFGLILIVIVLLFFINFRAAIVIATILPLAFLITLSVLYVVGFTINILTLFAMILSLGVLVDNAIVIVEGVVFELEKGKKKFRAVIDAVNKFAPAVTSATATTLVVFIPFAFLPGIVGQFMKFIPITIIIMLASSYLLAITVTPLLSKWILSSNIDHKQQPLATWQKALILPLIVRYGQLFVDWLAEQYKGIMLDNHRSLARLIGILLFAIVVVVTGFSAITQLEGQQFPQTDSAFFQVNYSFENDTPSDVKDQAIRDIQNEVVKIDYFESFYFFQGSLAVLITNPTERADDDTTVFDLVDELDENLNTVRQKYPELDLEAKALEQGPPVSEFDLILELQIEDQETQEQTSAMIAQFARENDKVKEVEDQFETNTARNIQITFDNQKLKENNLSPLAINNLIQIAFSEIPISNLTDAETLLTDTVALSFRTSFKDSIEDLERLPLDPSNPINSIQLKDVAQIEEVTQLRSTLRLNGNRTIEVKFKLNEDVEIAEFREDLEEYLGLETNDRNEIEIINAQKANNFGISSSDQVSYSGASEEQAESFGNVIIVILLAFLAVYIILVNQFNSYLKPALISFVVIIGFAGVFPGLWFFGESLNLISGLGIVALVGIAVNDAIVFVDTQEKMKKEHPNMHLPEILAETGRLRLKPIMSTTITTVLGVLPLAVNDPFWRGLGICIIFGLLFSTFGTLFVVPVIENLSSRSWKKVKSFFQKKPGQV